MKKVINNKMLLFTALLIIMFISFFNMQNAKLLSSLYKLNLIKQVIWYTLGFVILFITYKINTKALFKYAKIFYFGSLFLLLLVLFVGKTTNGAKAWFNLGFFSFQPSELMKIALVLYLSEIASKESVNSIKDEFKLIVKIVLLTIIPSILVFLEPDTGAIVFYLLIAISILAFTPIHKFWFAILILILGLFLGTFVILYLFNQDILISLIGTSFFYRVERIITFKTSSSYQLENALIAIGSSSFLGTGLNKVSLYIPEAPTDFIFAFSISNFGILTGITILICYLLIDIFLIHKYFSLKDKQYKLILISFVIMFIFQQVISIGMNLGLLPIIGIPLPFLSYGGTNLIIYFIFLGIILKIFSNQSYTK